MRRCLAACVVLACWLCACDAPLTPLVPITTAAKLPELEGALVVGISPDYPPFAYLDAQGKPQGLDVALAGELAAQMGMTLELREMKFDALLDAVNKKQITIAIAALVKTPERESLVEFSNEYFRQRFAVLAQAQALKPGAALETLPWRIAVYEASQYANVIEQMFPMATPVAFTRWKAMAEAVRSGEVDAAFMDMALADRYAKAYSLAAAEMATDASNTQGICIAMPKGNAPLRVRINEALDAIGRERIDAMMADALSGMDNEK